MKKTILLILTFIFININICIAQINGHLTDRLEKSLIKEYFPNYDNTSLNLIDDRILEIKNNNNLLGYIFSTWDMVKSLGYDRQPYEIIVGLNTSGTIAGAKLTYHNEPLFSADINESDLLKYVERTKDINIVNGMSRASRDKPIRPDTVHRGTISSNLMHAAIFKSARNVSLSIGLFQASNLTRLNYIKEVNMSWSELVNKKYVVHKKNFIINDKNTEIVITLIKPRLIGYNVLKKKTHDKLMANLNAQDNAILLAGNGYSFKGDKWRNTKVFDRFRIVQGENIILFKASDHTRISKIQAKNAPKFKEVSIFKISTKYNFDPTKPWYLEFINTSNRQNGSNNIIIPYLINDELIIYKNKPLPIWLNVWLDSKFRIIILLIALTILTFITIFQDKISKYKNIYRYIRISYLSFTLLWIGWYTGAQLSIFNILSLVRIPITGADLTYFLIDPLIFIILIFTIISSLILGRGLFCGWLCPFGALQELISYISKLIGIKKKEIHEKYHKKLWTIKYFILITIVGTSFISMETASAIAEIEPFKTSIMRHFNRGIPYVSYAIILLMFSVIMERSFCRFICPLGASIAIIGKFRITNHLNRREACGNPCNLCSTSCPVKAIPTTGINKGKIIMSECFRCLDCQLEYVDNTRCPPLIKLQKQKIRLT